ncbi:uncharacterized protein A4U43_C07F1390 [Asparagus officinalis]|uniref:Calcineurin B-like protein n=1 Tax=Asparagus officinalis TaxID=4686 RepID=A0A5P1E8M8_ASPOF|nr:uncharacterized protein A4U43_C07F1390 [Asparagus officinalis]
MGLSIRRNSNLPSSRIAIRGIYLQTWYLTCLMSKGNGVIDFGEFVRSLSIFHPDTAQTEKISFAFRLYDLRRTGYNEGVEEYQTKQFSNGIG